MDKKYFVKIEDNLSLQILEIGNFKRGFVSIICQLHGDEYSSLLIVKSLAEKAKDMPLGLRIILNANPLGSLLGVKNEPVANLNFNRTFETKSTNPLTKEIIKLIKGSKFCIDLHDMPGSSLPVSAILTITGNLRVEKQNKDLISKFQPQIAWIENFSKPEMAKRYNGTINSYLNSINVPNFTIETSGIETFSNPEEVARKIIDLLSKNQPGADVLYVKRQELYSPISGVITTSTLPLLEQVAAGVKLATIFNGKTTIFKSPVSGLLIRKVNQKFIKKDEKIFDLGVRI